MYLLDTMRRWVRLGFGVAFLVGCHSGATLGPGTHCDDQAPCRPPLTCVRNACELVDGAAIDEPSEAADATNGSEPAGSGAAGRGGSGGAIGGKGGSGGGGSGGGGSTDSPVRCAAQVSSGCSEPAGRAGCEEVFCAGRLWPRQDGAFDGLINYRIEDPAGQFSDADKSAIRAAASAWTDASEGLVAFHECSPCQGRFVTIVPGTGDGIVDPTQLQQVLPMPVGAGLPFSAHQVSHQWGHAIGLAHTYERADRDRYVRFDPAIWCGPQGSGLPPRCAYGPNQPGIPPIATDTFGVYDELSKMNGFTSDGVCGSAEPDRSAGLPTEGDGSAVEELYLSHTGGWAPFQPIARSVSSTQPLDYELAPGVDPVGSPAIAEWRQPAVDIAARGTDGAIYATHNDFIGSSFLQWAPWRELIADVDADPALAVSGADTLYLAVRARADGSIRLLTRSSGIWGASVSLGAPPGGAASGPAIAALDGEWLKVFVLGADGLLYGLTCPYPASTCAGSIGSGAWSPLPGLPPRTFISKPSVAVAWPSGDLFVAAVARYAAEDTAWIIDDSGADYGPWQPIPSVSLNQNDPNPGIAIEANGEGISTFARNAKGRLVSFSSLISFKLGGLIAGPPAVSSPPDGDLWVHIAAVIVDHGRPGVWLKFYGLEGGGFQPPCNYNVPGTCAQCGCGLPNTPACL